MRRCGTIRIDARLRWGRLLWMRRHQNAPAVAGVGPSVVRTLEGRAVDYLPEGQPCASVHTQVPPGEVLRARTPQDDVVAQETRTTRPTRSELVYARHREPVIDQDRIVDHGSGQTLTLSRRRPTTSRSGISQCPYR